MSDGKTIYLIVHDVAGSRYAYFVPDVDQAVKDAGDMMKDHGGTIKVVELGADVISEMLDVEARA